MARLVCLTACPLYNSELCGSAHNTEAILLVCCCHLFGFNLPKAISKWFSMPCSFISGRKKICSLKFLARSGSDPQKACPNYSSELCGSTHNTEGILLVCWRSLFGFNLPKAMIYNSLFIFGRKECSLKWSTKSGSDSQKACPLYSRELCGSAQDTEAILLVCCRHLFGFNLPKSISKWISTHCSFLWEKRRFTKSLPNLQ